MSNIDQRIVLRRGIIPPVTDLEQYLSVTEMFVLPPSCVAFFVKLVGKHDPQFEAFISQQRAA